MAITAMDRSLQLQCAILLSLGLVGLTAASPPYHMCGAANYDVRNLTSKMWRFAVPSESCLRPKTANDTGRGCDMTMAFCRSVNLSLPCSQAAVCESFGSPGNDSYNLASYKPNSNPFDTEALKSGVGFMTRYENGETYTKGDNSTCALSTVMTFRCNLHAPWDSEMAEDVLTVPGIPTVHFTQGASVCTYNVTFDFAGACPVVIPSQPVSQLSPGSVLLIIFLVSVALYLSLGVVINVFHGQSGLALLPHHDFWTELPGYIRDGVQFTLRCGGQSSGRHSYESI